MESAYISEFEYIVNNTRVIVKDRVFFIDVHGEQTSETAYIHLDFFEKLREKSYGKYSFLVDLNNAEKNSSEARKVWQEISDNPDTHKVALYGIHPVAKVLASFVMGVSKRKNIRFFFTFKEAMEWVER